MKGPGLALVTVFGLGLLRPAPGTWGSLPGPALALLMLASGAPAWAVNAALGGVAVVFGAACASLGARAERRFGMKDPPQVVADETAGQCVALLALPWGEGAGWNLLLAATAFVAFRVFDILKPPPIDALQRARGGWGILLDDVLAGVYALAAAQLAARLLWPLVT